MSDYQQLAARFGEVRSSWKRTAALSGLAIVITEGIGILTVLLFLDWLYQPRPVVRLCMWAVALAGIVWLVLRHVAAPLSRKIPDEQIAMYIEEHRNDLDGVLITAAEFGRNRDSLAVGQGALIDMVLDQASSRARMAASHVVDLTRLKKYCIAAGAGIGLYILLATLFPNAIGHHVGRILKPWQATSEDLPKVAPGAVRLEPIRFSLSKGDASLARGTSFDFEATLSRTTDKPVELNFRPHAQGEAGKWQKLPMTEIEKLNGFQGTLSDVSESLDFYVSSGNDKSETHRLTVFDPLVIQSLEAVTHYPAYVKLPDRVERPSTGDIEALEGSTVTVRINASTPLKEGTIKWGDGQTVPLTVDAKSSTGATFTFDVKKDATYDYALTDVNGQQAASAGSLSVKSIPDQPPTVAVNSPKSPVLTNPLGEINFDIDSGDDFGVEGVDLVYARLDENDQLKESRIPLTLAAGDSKDAPNAMKAVYTLMLEKVTPPFKADDAISYHLEARDAKGQKAVSEIGFIIVGYYESWGTWTPPHGPEEEETPHEQPSLMDMLSLVWTLHSQKPNLAPADFQNQSKEIAGKMVDEKGNMISFVDTKKMPQLAKVAGKIALHAKKAHDALLTADTATANTELSIAATIYNGFAIMEDSALKAHVDPTSTAGGKGATPTPSLTMLEQARLDALSQSSNDKKGQEQQKEEAKAAAAAGKQIDDLIKKQDDVVSKAKDKAAKDAKSGAQPAKDAKAEAKGEKDDLSKTQKDIAAKTKAAAEAAKAGAKGAAKPGAAAGTQSKLDQAAAKTTEAAKTMDEAAKDFAAGKNAEGGQKATAAKKALQEAKDVLQDTSRDKLEAAISEAAARTAALLEKQGTLRGSVEPIAKELDGGKTPDQRQKRDLQKQAFQQTGLRADDETLNKDIDNLSSWAAQVGQAEAIRALGEAQKTIKRAQPEAKMAGAIIDLNNASPASAVEGQKKAEAALEKILEDLHAGSDALAATKEAQLRRAQRNAAEAKKGIEEVAKTTGEKPGEQAGKDAKAGAKPGEQNKPGEQAGKDAKGTQPGEKPGEQAGKDAKAGAKPGEQNKPGEQAGKDAKGTQPGEQPGAQSGGGKQQAVHKLAYDLQRLAATLDNRELVSQKDVDTLKEMSMDKAELEKRLAVDPKLLKDASDIVARISDKLEAEAQAKTEAGKLFSSQREECPPAYRQFVNQYFEALSQKNRPPGQTIQP